MAHPNDNTTLENDTKELYIGTNDENYSQFYSGEEFEDVPNNDINCEDTKTQPDQNQLSSKNKKNAYKYFLCLVLIGISLYVISQITQKTNSSFNIKFTFNESQNVEKEVIEDISSVIDNNNIESEAKNIKVARMVIYDEQSSDNSKIISKNIKQHPFVPLVENGGSYLGNYEVITPPEQITIDEMADKLMQTTLSGILYDSEMPLAIVNLDGKDQLVKKGDTIGGFKILDIQKNKVIVKQNKNVYRVSVGQKMDAESINYTDITNLTTRFGGKNKPNSKSVKNLND